MRVTYTRHAREMMSIRNILQTLVEKCIEDPDEILPAREGKKTYLKNFGRNFLRVIAIQENGNSVVITVHWFAKKQKS